jgi:hypothetical protein
MASIIASRPWRGYDDLRPMQELALEQRRRLGPRAPWHVGDVAWGLRQHEGREPALRRWHEEGGREAIDYCVSEPACALYESLGLRRHATLAGHAR